MKSIVMKAEEIRIRKGVTKTHIAKQCGKSVSWYSDIVKGRRRVYLEDLTLIASAMELEMTISFDPKLSESLSKRQSKKEVS